jgi:serine/threonine protein phosphatase PrpC
MRNTIELPKATNHEKPVHSFKIGERAKKILLNSLALDELTEKTVLGNNYHLVDTLRNDLQNPKYQQIYDTLVDFANIWNRLQFDHHLSLEAKNKTLAPTLKDLNNRIVSVFNLKVPEKVVNKPTNSVVKFIRKEVTPPLTAEQINKLEEEYKLSDWNPENNSPDWGDAVDNAMYNELEDRVENLRDQQNRTREYNVLNQEWSQRVYPFLESQLGADLIKRIFADCLVSDLATNTNFYELNNVFSPYSYHFFIKTKNSQERVAEFYGRLFDKIVFRLDGNNHSEARKLLSTILLHGLSEDSKKTLDSLNLRQISGSFSQVDITDKQYADIGKVFQQIILNPPIPDDVEHYPQYVDPQLPEEPVTINNVNTTQPDSKNKLKNRLQKLGKISINLADKVLNQARKIPGVDKKLSQLRDFVGFSEVEYEAYVELKVNYDTAIDNEAHGEDIKFEDKSKKLFIIADGVSGNKNDGSGKIMSNWAVKQLETQFDLLSKNPETHAYTPENWQNAIQNILKEYSSITAQNVPEKGATTLNIIKIVGDKAVIVTIGDSMVYQVNSKNELSLVNVLHTDINFKLLLAVKEMNTRPDWNLDEKELVRALSTILLKYTKEDFNEETLEQIEQFVLCIIWNDVIHFGSNSIPPVDFKEAFLYAKNMNSGIYAAFPKDQFFSSNIIKLNPGDKLISATDGLENVGYQRIREILYKGGSADDLVKAGTQTKMDDCTVQIISME